MTEKEVFIQAWEREFQTNLKVLHALPENKLEVRPDSSQHTAKDLAWSIVAEEKEFIGGGVTGSINLTNIPKPPSTLKEIIATYERAHEENIQKVKAMTDAEFNKLVKGYSSPKFNGEIRRADVLWGGLIDAAHHRGQLSVYLGIAGAHVPQSTYAPMPMTH